MAVQKKGFAHESQGVETVEWYTPPWIFESLDIKFDIDVCAPEGGVEWIPSKRYYTKEDDGLTSEWVGNIWCNPPYGKYTSTWLEKMHQHRNGISLVFARTDCRWYHNYVAKADAILYLKGRVKFVDGDCVSGGSGAGSGSMLIAWGKENIMALVAMRDKGHLVVKGGYYGT